LVALAGTLERDAVPNRRRGTDSLCGAHRLEAFLDITVEQKGLEVGYVIGFLGLLGLYPTLADRRPWLARAGAVAAILGVVAFSVFTFVCRY
jgi:hypothetical protein